MGVEAPFGDIDLEPGVDVEANKDEAEVLAGRYGKEDMDEAIEGAPIEALDVGDLKAEELSGRVGGSKGDDVALFGDGMNPSYQDYPR